MKSGICSIKSSIFLYFIPLDLLNSFTKLRSKLAPFATVCFSEREEGRISRAEPDLFISIVQRSFFLFFVFFFSPDSMSNSGTKPLAVLRAETDRHNKKRE